MSVVVVVLTPSHSAYLESGLGVAPGHRNATSVVPHFRPNGFLTYLLRSGNHQSAGPYTKKWWIPITAKTPLHSSMKYSKHTHTHTHSVLTAIFPGEPVLAGCPLNSPSPFIPHCTSFWDRPKLSMSFLTQSHQVFFDTAVIKIK